MRSLIFTEMPMEHEQMPSDKEIVRRNLFSNNVGNEYFFNGVVRTLNCEDNIIKRYTENTNVKEYDMALLINANQIKNEYQNAKQQYETVKSMDIPFTCMCVGSDSNSKFELTLNEETKEIIYDLYTEVLNRSKTMGVRGEWTKKVLTEQVGINSSKIDVIGCPSVRYFGKNITKRPTYPEFSNKLKIAVNYTAYAYNYHEALYLALILERYQNSFMIFTDKCEAELLWYKKEVPEKRRHEILPSMPNHPFMGKCRFQGTQKGMMGMLRTFDFSIGSRIHQAIVSILSGCPTIVIAHSMRILELAQYHHIPYVLRSELIEDFPPVEELYYRACEGMKYFYDNYDKTLKEYIEFLEKNDILYNKEYME